MDTTTPTPPPPNPNGYQDWARSVVTELIAQRNVLQQFLVGEADKWASINREVADMKLVQERELGILRLCQEKALGEMRVATDKAITDLRLSSEKAITDLRLSTESAGSMTVADIRELKVKSAQVAAFVTLGITTMVTVIGGAVLSLTKAHWNIP
jgi:hypothetical protein